MENELIPCPSCEEELSPYVLKCPKCGQYMHRRGRAPASTGSTIRVALMLIFGGIGVLGACALFYLWSRL